MKAELEEGGGRILLGDNTGGGSVVLRSVRFLVLQFGAVVLRSVRFLVLQFGLQPDCSVYTYTVHYCTHTHTHTQAHIHTGDLG